MSVRSLNWLKFGGLVGRLLRVVAVSDLPRPGRRGQRSEQAEAWQGDPARHGIPEYAG